MTVISSASSTNSGKSASTSNFSSHQSSSTRRPLSIQERINTPEFPPPHHVLSPAAGSSWSSYLPHWNPFPEQTENGEKVVRTGFCNPWPSAHRPTPWEVWENLEWGVEQDAQESIPEESSPSSESRQDRERKRKNQEILKLVKPDFSFNTQDQIKTTWLGHAGVLLQFPSVGPTGADPNESPIRVLFDPIFSERCSPTQLAGPIRSYPAPCSVSDLPPIDVVVISHSHYDHLDFNTISELWSLNSSHIRFIVPLGNKTFFTSAPLSVPEDQVSELDWWDEVSMASPDLQGFNPMDDVTYLRLVCTPAQHGSGRVGLDANTTLWASWTLEYHPRQDKKSSIREPFRIFFGGDTGYQFRSHQSPQIETQHPIKNSVNSTKESPEEAKGDKESSNGAPSTSISSISSAKRASDASSNPVSYPVCPAFQQISARLGPPHLLLLPISVGATISFLKSFDPIPPAWSPFPRIDPELNSSNHMGPEDAVRVMKVMTQVKEQESRKPNVKRLDDPQENAHSTVAVGIHWGTFVSGENEVKNSIRGLRSACEKRGVHFGREYSGDNSSASEFILINHGQSISQRIC